MMCGQTVRALGGPRLMLMLGTRVGDFRENSESDSDNALKTLPILNLSQSNLTSKGHQPKPPAEHRAKLGVLQLRLQRMLHHPLVAARAMEGRMK